MNKCKFGSNTYNKDFMKIIILILSLEDNNKYTDLENCVRRTWAKNNNENITFLYYYGNSDKFNFIGDKIYTKYTESLYNIGFKTLDSFDYIYKNMDFDYLFRTNTSSYININKMIEYLKEKPRQNYYSARINVEKNGIKFGSGSGYFLSKDLIKFVLDNKSKWNHNLIDDVALGDLLLGKGFELFQNPRLDIDDITEDNLFYNLKPIDVNLLDINFHFRCKSKDPNRQIDISIIEYLHNHFNLKDKIA
jgi:hypothetical protein